MDVRWSAQAVSDVAGLTASSLPNYPKAAGRLAEAILTASENLNRFPMLGRRVTSVVGFDVRELVVARVYVIRYEIFAGTICIIRVRRASERWSAVGPR